MKRLAVATALMLLSTVAAASSAVGDVDRYQYQYATWTVTAAGSFVHEYFITVDPCDGTFSGNGGYPAGGPYSITETITGDYAAGTFTATYNTGYYYMGDLGTNTATDSNGNTFSVTAVESGVSFSTWRNHGEFVKSFPKEMRSWAAMQCIGRPVASTP